MSDLSNVPVELHEDFLRRGALNAIWKAHSCDMAVEALDQDLRQDHGLPIDKAQARAQLVMVAKTIMASRRDQELSRALEELKLWDAYRRGELDDQLTPIGV